MGWLFGYLKRKPLTLTGGPSGGQTNFQLDLTIAHAAAMQSDFDDLRFTQADGTTLIDAWLESKVDGTSATVLAEFPTTPANTIEQDYYMYYGNAGAASYWDGDATFIDYIDNEGSLSEWDVTGGGVSATTDHPFKGSYGIKFPTTGASPYPEVQKNCVGKNRIYETWIYDDMITTTNFMNTARLYDTAGHDPLVGIWTSTSHYIYRPEGGSWTASSVARSSGWHKLTFVVRDSDTLIYIDDTLIFTETSLDEDNLNYFRVIGYTGGTGYSDTYLVRKYASGPPTYAFGSEESAPTGGRKSAFYGPFIGPLGGPIQ